MDPMLPPPLPRGQAPRWPHHLAAIDMGSNSFRLDIGEVVAGGYRRIAYLKETVRLGAGLDATGMLTEEAARRGLACLDGFAQRLSGYDAQQVRAVATQTLREARNRDAFLVRAQAALGHPIEVISGREEARLIYSGVARLQPSALPRLVIDIGGRSTEMIIGTGLRPQRAESFQVGSVSLSMRFFPEGRLGAAAFRQAQIAAGAELEEALMPFARHHWQEALGASGTVGAVSQLLLASGRTDGTITPEGLRWCIRRCVEAGHIDQLEMPGLRDDRRQVIAGGLSLLYTLATHFGIDALRPAQGALRQGVIFDLAERRVAEQDPAQARDMRDASVRELQRRFMVDVQQAANVARLAQQLYNGAAPAARDGSAGEGQRELLWAAALHETGMMVSHHDHHRHSAYLLGHVDAAGFSQSQQRRLADLVLAQRGSLRKIEPALANPDFAWQALCLRLAIIKCHARRPIALDALRLRRDADREDRALLVLAPGWAERNPRTLYLLNEEIATWDRSGPLRLRMAPEAV